MTPADKEIEISILEDDDYRQATRAHLIFIKKEIERFKDSVKCQDKRAASLAATKLDEAGMWFTSSFFTQEERDTFAVK